ncbi:zinc-binding dehydrogenase [Clostridium sp. BJN0013]|uniref:zinc-binding dehydrogenase n=1 Tax=Clostridium sp. BJN0013 TaxID=3236840 RepID=UPI0034C61182
MDKLNSRNITINKLENNEKKSTIKALIYHGIRNVKLEEKELPICGPDDVIVRNVRAGICGTDITGYLHGGEKVQINPGREFGHEMVGYIYEKGENVKDVEVGTRVFVEPSKCTPNQYEADMAGAFSQYVRVQNAKIGYNLYILPDNLSYDDAVLIEPFSVATHGKNTAKAKPNENILIIGAGTIGLCALCSLAAQGNKKIVVLDIDDTRLKAVQKLGGIGFSSLKGPESTIKFLENYFGILKNTNHRISYENGKMTVTENSVINIDVVIDCAGIKGFVDEFMKHAKQHSRYTCIALHKQPVTISFHELMSTQCALMGSRGFSPNDIEEVISNLAEKKSKAPEIITHKFPLENAEKAFEIAADPTCAIKVVLDLE